MTDLTVEEVDGDGGARGSIEEDGIGICAAISIVMEEHWWRWM